MKFAGREELIKRVQSSLGLTSDGIDGRNTWNAIADRLAPEKKPASPSPPANSTPPQMPSNTLYKEIFAASPHLGGNITPKFIVLHHSGGSHDGSRSWILDPKSKVSYHYLIATDGSITQFVPENRAAWHAGVSSWKGFNGLNSHSIGISFWGDTYSREPSEVEIDSCARKCIDIIRKYKLTTKEIITHKMIAPGRKNDTSGKVHDRVIQRVLKLAPELA
jgi:N-acetyl-anhydromuramyl-L-alanine amidase AmpD